MSLESIFAEIDSEIGRLQQVKLLLTDAVVKKGPGRPRRDATTKAAPVKPKRRKMSVAARAKIAAAQKARWARAKKRVGKAATAKVESAT